MANRNWQSVPGGDILVSPYPLREHKDPGRRHVTKKTRGRKRGKLAKISRKKNRP